MRIQQYVGYSRLHGDRLPFLVLYSYYVCTDRVQGYRLAGERHTYSLVGSNIPTHMQVHTLGAHIQYLVPMPATMRYMGPSNSIMFCWSTSHSTYGLQYQSTHSHLPNRVVTCSIRTDVHMYTLGHLGLETFVCLCLLESFPLTSILASSYQASFSYSCSPGLAGGIFSFLFPAS